MYQNKTFLAIIPARGGSKGLPRKNIRDIGGKPLIAWTIEAAKASKYLDRVVVSTEDDEIAAVAKKYGGEVPFMRPASLAADDSPGIEATLHAMDHLPPYDFVVTLQPTSPLRTAADIDGAIGLCLDNGADSCVSVTEPEHSPYWMYRLDGQNFMIPLLTIPAEQYYRRQSLPKTYRLNGAVYVTAAGSIRQKQAAVGDKTLAYIMPQDRSVDIDSELDLAMAELLLKNKGAL